MSIQVPTTIPITFDCWDNDVENATDDWHQRFLLAGRPSQRTEYGDGGIAVENGLGKELLRLYADIVSHTDFDATRAIQNLTEFKLGGAINIAVNQDWMLGLVWNYRPVIPRSKIPAYREIWQKYAHVPSKDFNPEKLYGFLDEAVPLLGQWSLELPRGYGEVTKTAAQSAAAEVEEELQVQCLDVQLLGLMGEDMAQNPALNTYNYVRMNVRGKPTNGRDLWEKIAAKAEWLTLAELYQAIRDGYVIDPFTLTGLKMLEIFKPDVYALMSDPPGPYF